MKTGNYNEKISRLLHNPKMYMYYWFGTKLENFLFYGYDIITTYGLISTCLGLSALAILYEAMKLIQIKLREITKDCNQLSNLIHSTDSSSLISEKSNKSVNFNNLLHGYTWLKWLLELFHRCIHVILGYLLMLAVMTFNGYISIAIALGSGIGYYIFGLILIKLNITKLTKHHKLIQCNPECADSTINDRSDSSSSVISEPLHTKVSVNVDVHVKAES